MGFRFRRSFKVLPGVHLNVGKSGFTSVSIGGRGNRLNFSKKGTRHTIGIPGTGLSYSSLTSHKVSEPSSSISTASPTPTVAAEDLERFGIVPDEIPAGAGRSKWLILTMGLAGILAFAVLGTAITSSITTVIAAASLLAILVGLFMPSRAALERAELTQCANRIETEKATRIAQFRQRATATNSDLASLASLLDLQRELRLTDQELGSGIGTIRATKALLEWEQTIDGKIPTLQGHETAIRPDDACFFVSAAMHDKRGDADPSGTLYFTDKRAFFLSDEGSSSVPWTKVVNVTLNGNEVRLQRHDRQNPTVFWISDLTDAMKAHVIAKSLLVSSTDTSPGEEQPQRAHRPPRSPDYGKLSELPIADERTFDVGSGIDCSYGIVGESNYQAALRTLDAGRRARGEQVTFIAELVLEPNNPYDANAVKVVADGKHLGYLPKDDAAQYQAALRAIGGTGKRACCHAKLIGGTAGKPSLGVMIDLRLPQELLAAVVPQPF